MEGRKKGWENLLHVLRGKESGRRTVIQKFTLQQSQLCVNLSVIHFPYNMIMSFRRLNLLQIMLWPIRRQTPHSYIPKYAEKKSVFCSTDKTMGGNCGSQCDCQAWVEGQVWRSCTTLWSKRPTICVGLICANQQHSLEFPTDQPGIYLKNRELVKDLCRGTSPSTPSALNISCSAWSLTKAVLQEQQLSIVFEHQLGRQGKKIRK